MRWMTSGRRPLRGQTSVTFASASRRLVRRPAATLPPPMRRMDLSFICHANISEPPGRIGGYFSLVVILAPRNSSMVRSVM